MTAAFAALIVSALPQVAPASVTRPASTAASVEVFDALVATEETPDTKALLQNLIFHHDRRGRAIVIRLATSSIA